ncbi:MAG: translation initiation factor IF-2 [Patescibacteria group bacterium]|nr:translation initiation factor IF-2 [Patescibacteria group bacterium]
MTVKNKKSKNSPKTRPPIVVVLGHVDHGKSSLLEAVKDLKITEKEAGGITQRIGAYMISHKGKEITFIDTPGHEAFSKMRSRGADIADVGILVVAADEGVKKQTKEAIQCLKDSKIPFVVAINKIDKKQADIEKTKQDLAKEQIFLESYGGEVPSANISCKNKEGIDELLELVGLVAEMEGLEMEEVDGAEGVVIESIRDPKKGTVINLLIKKGTLRKGDFIGTEHSYGKIRTIQDFLGKEKEEAGESTPVQITGIKDCLSAGEDFFVFEKIEDAKRFVSKREIKEKNILSKEQKTVNIILKVDGVSSLEAVESSLSKIPQEEVAVKIIKADIGNITESDIEWAKTEDTKIIAFNVSTEKSAEKMAIQEGVKIEYFDIIYELIDFVKKTIEGMLEPELIREEIGKIKILVVFRTQKNRQILGGKIIRGEAVKGALVEIQRDKEKIGEGKIVNLKKEEKDMEKISENEEIGMLLESKTKAEEEDVIVLYKEKTVNKTL